jgi:trk system potassium uptake protein TrkA
MRVVVVGAGEVGFNIADILSKEGNDIIIIDKDEERLKSVSENLDVQTIVGSQAGSVRNDSSGDRQRRD